ncbi:MAG: cytochrome c3 family protein [Thermodesulfobacteriota bacterium]
MKSTRRYIHTIPALLFLVIASSQWTAIAEAASIERMVMPGDVISGHAKYENKCSNCHKPFSKTTQTQLCLECHKKVAVDVKKRRGYHGISWEVKDTKCRQCHTEHKGRDADVVRLDKEIFEHRDTDFPLKGGHGKITCAKCHEEKKKYREAPLTCFECHEEDDVHRKKLGKKCGDCHSARSWSKSRYDHDKTKFPLKGKHRKVACNSCHPDNRYEKTPKDCYACHKLNDVHKGEYGKKCKECHIPKKWEAVKYDHDDTDFPLKGRHNKVECNQCHTGDDYRSDSHKRKRGEKKSKRSCYKCHKDDDEHRGRYGKKCGDCHTPREWKRSTFNHDKTDFPLKGKHRKVTCGACHSGAVYKEELTSKCYDCHKLDDLHKGKEGRKCDQCHNVKGWREKLFFDHDLTKFPLIGLHTVASCESCHVGKKYGETKSGCNDCHREDDEHKRKLGPKCNECHNPNGWALWRFNHDKATKFELDGEHKGLECLSCHKRPVRNKVRAARHCSACHKEDDIHSGGFGIHCERCHITSSFENVTIGQH